MTHKTNRIDYIDICKGTLILLLVWHHYMSATRRLQIDSPFFFIVKDWQFVFTAFFMPAFFLASGYCSNLLKDTKSFATSLVRQIVIPAIFFEFIRQFFDSVFYHDPARLLNHYHYDNVLFETTLWFLWALFWGKIICRLCFKYIRRELYIIALLLSLLLCGFALHHLKIGVNPCNYHEGLVASFYIGVGQIIKRKINWFEKLKQWSLFVYPASLLILKALHIGVPALTAGMGVGFKVIPIHIVLAISGTLFLLKICERIKHQSFLQITGRNSLTIYGIHFLFLQLSMKVVNDFIASPDSLGGFVIFTLFSYALVAVMVAISVWLFNKKPLSWVIGK